MQPPVEGFRLSPQQRRLWQLERRFAHAPSPFHLRGLLQLSGALDYARLQAALSGVVERHEILRTCFRRLAAMTLPVQVVTEQEAAPIALHDLSSASEDEQQRLVAEWYERVGREGFDLTDGRPLRAVLLKLGTSEHALVLGLPALCADAASLRNLVAEVGRGYALGGDGGEVAAEAGVAQYADLAEWSNELLEAEETAGGRAFWAEQCGEGGWGSPLPVFDEAEAGECVGEVRVWEQEVEAELVRLVEEAAREVGVRREEWLLGSWQVLGWRLRAGEGAATGGESCAPRRLQMAGVFRLGATT